MTISVHAAQLFKNRILLCLCLFGYHSNITVLSTVDIASYIFCSAFMKKTVFEPFMHSYSKCKIPIFINKILGILILNSWLIMIAQIPFNIHMCGIQNMLLHRFLINRKINFSMKTTNPLLLLKLLLGAMRSGKWIEKCFHLIWFETVFVMFLLHVNCENRIRATSLQNESSEWKEKKIKKKVSNMI